MSELIIRTAVASDHDAMRDLLQRSDAWHAERLPSVCREPVAPRLTAQELVETIANPRCLLVVAERDGRVVGFAEASQVDATRADEAAHAWCELHNLMVCPAYRRRGCGTRLVQAVEDWSRQRGLGDVRLTVFAFNTEAQQFYASLGYAALSHELIKRP